jgi:hypothetical protein
MAVQSPLFQSLFFDIWRRLTYRVRPSCLGFSLYESLSQTLGLAVLSTVLARRCTHQWPLWVKHGHFIVHTCQY